MDCPVCPRVDIPDDASVCPSCGVDLTPLLRVKELGAAEYNEALRLAEAGAADAAMGKAAAALALDHSLVPARVLLGKLLWNQGQARAALAQWQQAAGVAQADPEIRALVEAATHTVRRERLARVAGPAAAALLVLVLAAVAFLPYRAFANRLDGLAGQFGGEVVKAQASVKDLAEELAAYRAAHSHTDAEYAEAVAREALRKQEAEAERAAAAALSSELAAYQASHSHSNEAYDQAWAEVAALRRQVEELQRTVSAIRQSGDVRP
ncbi:MAG TPA: hypothetical protein VD902_07780 [Symbiobacteriaceae bacterium]|nr:hypothetical protein [Symbiobacteriaceae bacterium]